MAALRARQAVRKVDVTPGLVALSTRDYSSAVVATGGRSSVSGITATVFGASGFLSRFVCNSLGKIGSQIIAAHRGPNEYWLRHIKVVGDLGQVNFAPWDINDKDSIRRAVERSNVVINLVGREHETRNYNFERVHVDVTRTLAEISAEMGVDRFIHMSCLGASPDSGSRYYKSKYDGELAVRDVIPSATILRPAPCFGPEDRFLNRLARTVKFSYGANLNNDRRLQPIYANDVAEAVLNAIKSEAAIGQTYQLGGPKVFTYDELLDKVAHSLEHKRTDLKHLPPVAYKPLGWAQDRVPRFFLNKLPFPHFSMDEVDQFQEDVVVDKHALGLKDLHVEPTSIDFVLHGVIIKYKKVAHLGIEGL